MTELILLFVVIVAVGAVYLYRDRLVSRVTVFEYEQALRYSNGRFDKVMETGSYWYSPLSTSINTVDTREQVMTLAGQEVLSADGITLKVSIAAKYKVTDAKAALHELVDYRQSVYLEFQLALRELITRSPIAELLEKRDELSNQLEDVVKSKLIGFGVELISAGIKDIMFPGALKQIFAEVVKAKQEGLAALERARGETAALRNLANAAKLLDKNPALMQLRLIQTLDEHSGKTVVLNLGSDKTPLLFRNNPEAILRPAHPGRLRANRRRTLGTGRWESRIGMKIGSVLRERLPAFPHDDILERALRNRPISSKNTCLSMQYACPDLTLGLTNVHVRRLAAVSEALRENRRPTSRQIFGRY